MTGRIFAISDIHGCYIELMCLMKKLEVEANLDYEKDVVIFLGDYIDRGPDSKKVVEQMVQWHKKYPHWGFLYGNHEDIFKDFLLGGKRYGMQNWFGNGGNTTWASYGGHFGKMNRLSNNNEEFEAPRNPEFPKEHLDFLFKETMYLIEEGDYYFVHAGLIPGVLGASQNMAFPDTLIWAREGFIESDFDWGKKVIFGHTADYKGKYYNPKNSWGKNQRFMPIVMKNKIGIDTAVCPPASQRLTALELPLEKYYFQESLKGGEVL